jgi:valyl-tRNA synthetase
MQMDKNYQPKIIEAHWAETWEKAGCFRPEYQTASLKAQNSEKTFCIMLPPPNVTGSLHMGHGFQHTLMDALIRYHRACGFETLWQGGVDHASIATQLVVERKLEAENITLKELGRDKFIEKVYEWKNHSGGTISQQMRRLGTSVDWSRERFTMDEGFKQAVNAAFIKLYEDGLIYRGKRLVNWDVKLQTAVSDLEAITSEEEGNLWTIKYYLNASDYLCVATTRPETLFGDIAIAVHPKDSRYQKFIGQKVQLPLTNKLIPIIADEFVEMDFGTGCVKITPAHDFNDYDVAKRHQLLELAINIMNKDGTLNQHAYDYHQLDRLIARKKIIEDLSKKGLLEKTEKYKVKIPRGEKSGEILEPLLTDQWYVKMELLAKRAREVVEKNDIKFVPESWSKTYLQWLENIQDWCISRQLWWGHRLPVYYNEKTSEVYVGTDENKIKNEHLIQDEDVLDTWFSAALWPFATLGWPDKTPDLEKFYPTSVLVTGFDIIFFWVARMVMFGLYFTNQVPFKEIYMTGLIRDQYGQKMSKSKGNVLDPIDLIDGISLKDLTAKRTVGLMQPKMAQKIVEHTQKEFPNGIEAHGTDALRFTYCALANTGRDIKFDLGRIAGYRNFCNKLWNAARFVLSKKENADFTAEKNDKNQLSVFDQYILSNLENTIKSVHENFKQYRFDLIAQNLYDFIWNDYCDWYLEFSKIQLNVDTLLNVLEKILILLHPLMPFITEEIYHRMGHRGFIQDKQYPQCNSKLIFKESQEVIEWLKTFITVIRNIRSENKISPQQKITVLLYSPDSVDHARVNDFSAAISVLARIEKCEWVESSQSHCATGVVNNLQIFVPLDDNIDIEAEKTRLSKEIHKFTLEIEKSSQKLNNPDYVNKAPSQVVEKEREKLSENTAILEKLEKQFERLENIK